MLTLAFYYVVFMIFVIDVLSVNKLFPTLMLL